MDWRIDERIGEAINTKITESLEDKIATKVRESLDDHKERESRASNIIIYKAKENDSDDASVRRSADATKAKELVDFLRGQHQHNKDVRLGKAGDKAPRPWKIQFSDPKGQAKFLKNAFKVKDHREFSKWSLAPDYAQTQRVEQKRLVEELEARKSGRELDLTIINNKIVKKKVQESFSPRANIIKRKQRKPMILSLHMHHFQLLHKV